MLELPDDPFDPLKLADWLELYAVLSPDSNSSRGDLEVRLRRAALFELEGDEAIESKILETVEEIEQRMRGAKEAYPFDFEYQGIVRLKSSPVSYPSYIFCLCLSYFGLHETARAPRLFEGISCIAAQGYLRGNAVRFAWPREELPSPFSEAIDEMCRLTGEGLGFRSQSELNRKDDTLDLFAWADFADKRSSKLLLFGQCSAGGNWEEKLADLQPKVFWDQWLEVAPVSPIPIKSFFIPHRVSRDKWDWVARKAGLLFDRCRIAYWAHQKEADYEPYLDWIIDSLRAAS